jgi:hypothetical protein
MKYFVLVLIISLCFISCDKSLNSSLDCQKYFEGYKTIRKEFQKAVK